MVVLDELGLADLSPEKPIKVLHSELERKAVLTSGETQQSSYSVVALSNWVVDAAQVNRGILIQRQKAKGEDLFKSAKELAETLIMKYANESRAAAIKDKLAPSLDCVAST
jgi:E3 ubiquitin-protein ligase RNF213